MTALRKKAWPCMTSPSIVCRTLGSSPCAASARVSAGRTNSDSSLVSAASSLGTTRLVGVVLEVGVGDGAQPIVLVGERRAMTSRVRGSLKPESSDERAEPDVAVGVRLDRLQQRRHGDRRLGAANGARGRACGSAKSIDSACRSRREAGRP